MDDQPGTRTSSEASDDIAATLTDIAQRSQRLIGDFLARQKADDGALDPLNTGSAFFDLTTRMMADPGRLVEAQVSLWQDYLGLWQATAERAMGGDPTPVAEPDPGDRRFKDAAWNDNAVYDFIKQSYLLTARWIQETAAGVEGLDDKAAEKVDFYTRQFVNALSPTNFVMTNPEVLRATLESGGENLVKGLANLLADLEAGRGKLAIKMVDADAFTVGEDVATTPGQVIMRNDLVEIIQYTPSTKRVHRTPLLIVTPWINKYYVLDLRPENSFIKWAVDQGHTVFVTSWVNPDHALADKTFDDYMLEGPLAAIDAIELATGESEVNLIGYCIGGTLVAGTLAYMKAKGDARVKSVSFFTTMIEFSEPGELGVFIDDKQLDNLDASMNKRGYLEGREMAAAFNMMRDNDLIWSFVVNNYLLGKDPFPFDLLYWNADSTRMPAAMHSFYLREMYLKNKLIEPGGLSLAGAPIDLSTIDVPAFILSTREDHIAPWKSTYVATQVYAGPKRFVLAASGHTAGVVNPPRANSKYGHWTNTKLPKDADAWLAGATQKEGSWWPEWDKWMKKHAGGDVAARQPGAAGVKALGAAPGTYVLVRGD